MIVSCLLAQLLLPQSLSAANDAFVGNTVNVDGDVNRGLRATTALGQMRRYTFYTKDLHLLSETMLSSAATPPLAYDYVWFNGEPLAQVATATGDVNYYFNDHAKTPLATTTTSANTTWRAEREPYGERIVVRVGADTQQTLDLPGQESVNDSADARYNIFRWYRPNWGRYTQSDPLGLAGGLHLFSYGAENPTRLTDPIGLVCGINVWTEDVIYNPDAGFENGFKDAWGHQWITWPGGSAGFWPKEKPTDPTSSVTGWVQSPDPKTKKKGQYSESETYFSQFSVCFNCDKTVQCVQNVVKQWQQSPPNWCLVANNCTDFVATVLSECGLSLKSPFQQLEEVK